MKIEFSYEELESKRNTGELKYSDKKQNSRRLLSSTVWNKFQIIQCKREDIFVDVSNYVICKKCSRFLKYNGTTTTGLKNHTCRFIEVDSNNSSASTEIKFTDEDKKLIRDSATKFIVNDLRPFYAIEGIGLNSLLSSVIDLVHKYPTISSDKIMNSLPSRNTLRKHVVDSAKQCKIQIKSELQKALNFPGEFAIAVDLWKDQYKCTTYAGIVAHYNIIENDKIERKSLVCLVNEVDALTKTAKCLRTHIIKAFDEIFDIDESVFVTKVKRITDRGKNIANAMSTDGGVHLYCYCHLINNLVDNICKNGQVQILISNASSLTNYMKTSGMNTFLPSTLKSFVTTRWNSVYMMLKSIYDNFDEIYNLLLKKEQETRSYKYVCKIRCMQQSEISEVINFLKIFQQLSINLESEKEITLHKVWPTFIRLKSSLISNEDDSELIANMKKLGTEYFQKNIIDFTPRMEHKLACFLHPILKGRYSTCLQDRYEIEKYIEDRSKCYQKNEAENSQASLHSNNQSWKGDDLFIDLTTSPNEVTENVSISSNDIREEIQNYLFFNVTVS